MLGHRICTVFSAIFTNQRHSHSSCSSKAAKRFHSKGQEAEEESGAIAGMMADDSLLVGDGNLQRQIARLTKHRNNKKKTTLDDGPDWSRKSSTSNPTNYIQFCCKTKMCLPSETLSVQGLQECSITDSACSTSTERIHRL